MQMTKKVLSIVLAVMMVVSMMSVMAVTANAATTVAQIGETEYTSLQVAIDAASSGDTIKLIDDFSVGSIEFPANKTIHLDFNGKTVTCTTHKGIVNNGTVYFEDSSSNADGGLTGSVGLVYNKKFLYITSGKYTATMSNTDQCAFYNEANTTPGGSAKTATIYVQGGTIDSTGYGIWTYGKTATVNVSDGTIISHNNSAVSGNGTVTSTTDYGKYSITISGGTLKSEAKAAVYHPNTGTLTISGGYIEGPTAVYTKAGTTKITGGTLKATGAKADYAFNGDGNNPTGDAFVADSCAYPGNDMAITISGGTFETTGAGTSAVASYAKQDDPLYTSANEQKIENFITGGTFEGTVDTDLYDTTYYTVQDNSDGTVSVVSRSDLTPVWEWVASTNASWQYQAKLTLKDGDTVVYTNVYNPTVVVDGDDFKYTCAAKTVNGVEYGPIADKDVEANGVIMTSSELTNAINAGGSWTLGADVTAAVTQSSNVNSTLDLNGHTIKNNGSAPAFTVGSGSTLTINDSSDPSTGLVKNTMTSSTAMVLATNNNGKLIVNGGTFENTANKAVVGPRWNTTTGSKITLNGGTFTTPASSVFVNTANNTLKVNGGTYSSDVTSFVNSSKTVTDNGDGTYTVTPSGYVCQIGSTKYETLQDAVDALGSTPGTVTLLADCGSGAKTYVNIAAGQDVTFDFGDYTFTSKWGFENHGKLTLTTNGTGGATAEKCIVDNFGELVVERGEYKTTGDATYVVWNHREQTPASSTTVNGGSLKNAGKDGWGIVVEGTGVSATINDGTVDGGENGYGISGIGNSYNAGYSITVTGGTVTGGDLGIYHPNQGTLTISGGTISGATGVYVKSGTTAVTPDATISGGTIKGTGAAAAYNFNGNGANPTGDALVVDNCAYPGGEPTVTISGGTFNSAHGVQIGSYSGNGITNLASVNATTNNITIADDEKWVDNGNGGYKLVKKTLQDIADEAYGDNRTLGFVDQNNEAIQVKYRASLLGVQIRKDADGGYKYGDGTDALRFIAAVDNTFIEGASDYGFIITNTSNNKSVTKTCKGTQHNTISTGDNDSNTTFFTAAVYNLDNAHNANLKVEFYIEKNGDTAKAKYTKDNTNQNYLTTSYQTVLDKLNQNG